MFKERNRVVRKIAFTRPLNYRENWTLGKLIGTVPYGFQITVTSGNLLPYPTKIDVFYSENSIKSTSI